jgi:hypothetical protein
MVCRLTKARGAYVIGTARRAKHGLLTALGADELIDYTEVDFAQAAGDVDIVLDTIGGDYAGRSLATMRDDGTLVSLSSPFEPPAEVAAAAAARGIKTGFTLVEPGHRGCRRSRRSSRQAGCAPRSPPSSRSTAPPRATRSARPAARPASSSSRSPTEHRGRRGGVAHRRWRHP